MAHEWTIDAGVGVGPIRFDMGLREVNDALGIEPEQLVGGDSFLEATYPNGVRVYWIGDVMEYVELVLALGEVSWTFDGVLFDRDARRLRGDLAGIGRSLEDESSDAGWYVRITGSPVMFWLEDMDSGTLDTAIVESPVAKH